MYECICCNYRSKLKHHLEQHNKTQKHRMLVDYVRPALEDYEKRLETMTLRHIQEVKDLYVSQERERKEMDQEMRLEVFKTVTKDFEM